MRHNIYLDEKHEEMFLKLFPGKRNNGLSKFFVEMLEEKYESSLSLEDMEIREKKLLEEKDEINRRIEQRKKEIKELFNFTKEECNFLIESGKAIKEDKNNLNPRINTFCRIFNKKKISGEIFLELINEAMKYGLH